MLRNLIAAYDLNQYWQTGARNLEFSAVTAFLGKIGLVLLVLNEVRGFVMAAPVVWGLYESAGSAAAWFIGLCMLAGIAFSVIVPLMIAAWAKEKLAKRRDCIPSRVS